MVFNRADALATVKKLQDDGISMSNPTVGLLSAMVYLQEQVSIQELIYGRCGSRVREG